MLHHLLTCQVKLQHYPLFFPAPSTRINAAADPNYRGVLHRSRTTLRRRSAAHNTQQLNSQLRLRLQQTLHVSITQQPALCILNCLAVAG